MPLEKNVEYSASAQQALNQGYRPCLKCRPDSAPYSCAWQGVNTTVNRAVKMLTQRLDANIESIAASLGISTRYLNKLFQENMQISAKRYRIYQQVLMAKQLLQQTQLSVEKVAESVGFASARQLQQHIKTYLRLTPSTLRKEAKKNPVTQGVKDSVKPMQLTENVTILLAYRPPYNWQQVRDFFAKRQIQGNELVHENGIAKIFSIAHKQNGNNSSPSCVSVKADITHVPEQNGFRLSFNAAYSHHTLAIISIVRRMLDLDASPQLIERALKRAGLPSSDLVAGLRIPGVASEFEAGCRAILGQQVSVAAAVNRVNQLHAYFAQYKNADNLETGFPFPSEIANNDLFFLKVPEARRQTLIELAKFYNRSESPQLAQEESGDNISTNFHANDTLKSPATLINIKGIGPWTVNYIAMRATGESDIWLNTDLVIKKQVAKQSEKGHTIKSQLAAPWRSYLTLNLWCLA